VDAKVTEASGTAERSTALEMLEEFSGDRRCTVGADKAYDMRGFVADLREINMAPHVAQNTGRRGGSAIDTRTTRHVGYELRPH
jgi:hypothetical protein